MLALTAALGCSPRTPERAAPASGNAESRAADPSAPAVVELSPAKDDALVYIDGELFGAADRAHPLVARVAAGPHVFRVSVPGSPDLFGALALGAGERTKVTAHTPLLDRPPEPDAIVHPVGLGQTLRIAFAPAADQSPAIWRFRLRAPAEERVMLVVADRGAPVDIAVIGDVDDQRVPMALVRDTDGLDGRDFAEFTYPKTGTVRIEVRSAPSDVLNRLTLRILKAPPPMLRDAKKEGRRLPPREAK